MFRILSVVVFAMLPFLAANPVFSQHPRDSFFDCGESLCDPCERSSNIFCDPCEPVPSCKKSSLWNQVTIYGWVQAGITVNDHGSRNQYSDAPNAPASRSLDAFSGNSYLLMTRQASDFSVNQTWIGATKKLDTKHGFDWGFTMDTAFGTDARFGQCFGDETFDYDWGSGDYYTSIVQLFAEVGYRNLKFRVGKFAPNMTHEALPAVATFFDSHAYACYNTPLTVSGAIAEYTVGNRLSFSAGWVAGNMTSFTNRFDDSGFLGNIKFRPTDRLSFSYNLYFGRTNGYDKVDDAYRFGRNYDTATHVTQTLICTLNLGKRWLYMIEGVWGNNNYELGRNEEGTYTYGINQHLIYTINKQWAIGLRAEWSHGKGTLFDLAHLTGGEGCDLYEITFGANWTPNGWFILRPELRYDWSKYDNGFKPFANATQPNQLTAGGSMIVKF